MKAAATISILLVSACATQKTTYLSDGREGHSINCSGSALSWNMCYEKAGELCKERGYEVVAKEGDEGSTVTGTQYGVYGGSVMTRTLLIACK